MVRIMLEKNERSSLPIFCRMDDKWKTELEKRLLTQKTVTLMALGDVKTHLLSYLNQRRDLEVTQIETKFMKSREKGMGVKIKVKKRV
jgi:hypothetical protein